MRRLCVIEFREAASINGCLKNEYVPADQTPLGGTPTSRQRQPVCDFERCELVIGTSPFDDNILVLFRF